MGAQLFRRAEAACAEAGAARLAIWVLSANERAQRFYARMGARPHGARRVFPLLPELDLEEVRLELDLTAG
ncbi:MAG: hypothetical protein H6719_08025 [Sandaracinaceae bacterium]|nr:hypothetical protein [Sandaracinaceae bacterium]